jgi:hypothetical protein
VEKGEAGEERIGDGGTGEKGEIESEREGEGGRIRE